MSDFLAAEGIQTLSGYAAEHVADRPDLVVVGNAISRGNPELEAVLEQKIRYCSLPETVREDFLWSARSIVLAGTHGKTTTTSLTGWLLTNAGLDPTVLVGGIALNLGTDGSSYRVGQGRDFVIEGDEYDSAFFDKTAKFLKLRARHRRDQQHRVRPRGHLRGPRRRAARVPASREPRAAQRSAAARRRQPARGRPREARREPGRDVRAARTACTWQARDVVHRDGRTHFEVRRDGHPFGPFVSPLLGLHNVRNALAAIAVGHARGGPAAGAGGGAAPRSRGIKRRLETVRASCAASPCSTISRTTRRPWRRRCRRCARAIRRAVSGPSSSRAPRRPAAVSSRMTSRARSARPTKW